MERLYIKGRRGCCKPSLYEKHWNDTPIPWLLMAKTHRESHVKHMELIEAELSVPPLAEMDDTSVPTSVPTHPVSIAVEGTKGKDNRPPRARTWIITSFNTKKYKLWKSMNLDDVGIRWFNYQLEVCPTTGKLHVQGYVEFYQPVRPKQVQKYLRERKCACFVRKGTREQCRDYCMKENTPWYDVNYPEWVKHGYRKEGTMSVSLGVYHQDRGARNDVHMMTDKIKAGASEREVFQECPTTYIKMSTGVKRAIGLVSMDRKGQHIPNFNVYVLYGPSRCGKTRYALDKHGPDNVYEPIWNGTKWWFDGYSNERVILINEYSGKKDQASLACMQKLLDGFYCLVETKGGSLVHSFETVYITSNIHPKQWYKYWDMISDAEEQSLMERITHVINMAPKSPRKRLCWNDLEAEIVCGTSNITPQTTSVPNMEMMSNDNPAPCDETYVPTSVPKSRGIFI